MDKNFSESIVTRYHFDDVVVRCETFEIEKSGEVKKLAPRAFNLLRYLIENRDRVVEKTELFEQVWNERFVTDNALTRSVADVRRALRDDANNPKYIETVPKRGYRFVAELESAVNDAPVEQFAAVSKVPVTHSRDWLRVAVVALAIAVLGLTATTVYHLFERETDFVATVPQINFEDKQAREARVVKESSVVVKTDRQPSASLNNPVPGKVIENPAAHQLYVEGIRLLNTLDPGKVQQSVEHFQRAINLDPNFALAHVGLAHYYLHEGRRRPETLALAQTATARALELDGNLAEAYALRGLLHAQYDWDFVAADKDMKRALELDSSSPVVQQDLALKLSLQGKLNESLDASRGTLKADPLNARLSLNVGWILYGTRKYSEALTHFQQMIAAGIYVINSYSWLAQIYDAQGRYDEAVEMDLKYRSLTRAASSETLAEFRKAYTTGGWRAYLEKVLEQRKEVATRQHVEPYIFAMLYARLGDKEQTLTWLERACEEKSIFVRRVNSDPAFDNFRKEPRFRSMVGQLGFAS